MGFTFTEEDLKKGSEGTRFNNGVPGRVKNVTVYMEEAGADGVPANTNSKAPKFKLFFVDAQGRKMNRACFDINPAEYPDKYGKTYEDALRKEFTYLNKVVEHTGGAKVFSFNDSEDLFSKIKQAIGTKKLTVFANYGSSNSPKEYIEPRRWLPAVESADTPDNETRLVADRLDNMVPPAPSTQADTEKDFF